MITDEAAKQVFDDCRGIIPHKFWQDDWQEEARLLPSQFHRGVTPRLWKDAYPSNCRRHGLVFSTFNIIPRFCFSCYKVSIEPRNALELFKLMVVFEQLKLPNDNSRKCMVEMRPNVSGAYKGLIYTQSIEEGQAVLEVTRGLIAQEISTKVPVSLKRGCSEYALSYPEYSKFDENGDGLMKYNPEWQKTEELADANNLAGHFKPLTVDTHNHPGFNLGDALAMLVWLRYAATVGDLSYLRIVEAPLPKLQKMHSRPPFRPVEDA